MAAFIATIATFMMIPQQFRPPNDFDQSVVTVEMAPGATLAQTGETVRTVETLLREQPEVESIFSRVNVGDARVTATLRKERKRTRMEFERALAPRLTRIPDARATFDRARESLSLWTILPLRAAMDL